MMSQAATGSAVSSPVLRAALSVILIACSLTICLARGPVRSHRGYDFAAPYVASHRMWSLKDPYGHYDFKKQWAAYGALSSEHVDISGAKPVYPLSTLVVLAPIAQLRWPFARALVAWGGFALYLLLLWRLADEVSTVWNARRVAFLCVGLCLSAAQTSFFTVNLTMEAFLGCTFGLLLISRRFMVPGALLVLLGFAIKPTTGFAFVLVLMVAKAWRPLLIFAAFGALLAAICAGVALHLQQPWLQDYKANMSFIFGPHGIASFYSSNAFHWELVNLQMPFYPMLHSANAANVLAYAVGGSLFGWWALRYARHRTDWVTVAAPAVLISLLPIYQRNYNLVLVLPALLLLCRNPRGAPWTLWLLAAASVVPLQSLMRKHIPGDVEFSTAGNVLIAPAMTWIVLAAAVHLLARPAWACLKPPAPEAEAL